MRHTRRQPTGRLSLRSRLLAGLITITALFLIVMGVVTTVVLGNNEQDQFNTDLGLTVNENLSEITNLQNGYAAAYINVGSRSAQALSGPSDTARDLQNLLNNLLANALRFTPPGGRIAIIGHEKSGATIAVANEGTPIAPLTIIHSKTEV